MKSTLFGYGLLIALLAGVWAFEIYQIPWTDMYYAGIMVRIGIACVAVVGLALVLGFTGQFSLGHAGFMAIGAYTAGYLNLTYGVHPVLATLAGSVTAAIGGLAVGLPSLRLSGDYLAVVTLGFNGIIIVIIRNMDSLGGALGLVGLPQHTSFGWAWTWAILGMFFFRNLLKSPHGRVFMAVRDNEIAVRSLGINTTQAKVTAFVVGAAWAGIAGGLLAFLNASISPTQFDYNRSIELIAMVVMGGTGSLSGPIIAAIVLTALPEVLRPIADYRMIIYALLLVGMMLVRPGGLMGTRELSDVGRALFRRIRPAS